MFGCLWRGVACLDAEEEHRLVDARWPTTFLDRLSLRASVVSLGPLGTVSDGRRADELRCLLGNSPLVQQPVPVGGWAERDLALLGVADLPSLLSARLAVDNLGDFGIVNFPATE